MNRAVGIIGTGWVGTSVAISTLHSGAAARVRPTIGGTLVLVPHMNEAEVDALACSAHALRDAAASLTA